MLTIEKYSKTYGSHLVLQVDLLHFNNGIHWIKGENGSGKTSFFRSIAGIIPCSGNIYFDDGTSLHTNPVKFRARVSYAEAEPQFPGFLTAKDLIRFLGHIRKEPIKRQNELIELFSISDFFEKPCSTYSSGMLKKVSLLMSFLGCPALIILDEPLITLDTAAQQIIFRLIRETQEHKNSSFFISSHQAILPTDLEVASVYLIQHKTFIQQ